MTFLPICQYADIGDCRYANIAGIGTKTVCRYADIEQMCRYCRCRYKYRHALTKKTPPSFLLVSKRIKSPVMF